MLSPLPPLIIPGGGRFPANGTSPLLVSIKPQDLCSSSQKNVIRWRFCMHPSGKRHAQNGPVIEGRIPPREATPYECCYEFGVQNMGYRKCLENSNAGGSSLPSPVLSLSVPGQYQVFAWLEDASGVAVSRTQFSAFEIVDKEGGVTMGA